MQSAFNNSFDMPAAAPRPAQKSEAEAPAPAEEESTAADASEATEAAGDVPDWRPTYDKYLDEWRAEADVARANAEATRAKYEAEAAAKAKADADAKKAAGKATDEEAERKERLAAALAEPPAPASVPAHKRAAAEQRAAKIKEAWELVKPKNEKEQSEKKSASAAPSSQWEEVSASHSSVEDISSATRSGATSSPASEKKPEKEAEKHVVVPAGITPTTGESQAVPAGAAATAAPGVADATPSLTLSLFTAPHTLSLSRVVAALGINLILPFINGVFLGFGEITAREAVRVGRLWWKGERAIAGFWRKNDGSVTSGSGARAVSGVGLSGGGGF